MKHTRLTGLCLGLVLAFVAAFGVHDSSKVLNTKANIVLDRGGEGGGEGGEGFGEGGFGG